MMDKFQLLHIVAGIGWEPEIRGALTVLVGSLVLFGSVWLILNTNLGNRLGTLIALAGFFGWMLVMGIVWWIYGIGLTGDSPTWEPKEIIYGDLSESESDVQKLGADQITVTPATEIVNRYCPLVLLMPQYKYKEPDMLSRMLTCFSNITHQSLIAQSP